MASATEGTIDLGGKTAVVTGASSGIGRQIALRLAMAGADCMLHAATSEADVERVAEQIRGYGRDARTAMADFTSAGQAERFFEDVYSWRDACDIWVNNAGADVLTGAEADTTFDEKLERLWQVDVLATIRLSRLAGARMKQAGSGAILNMGWDHAQHGMAGDSGEMFAAAKGAVMAFSKSLARSLAPEVRVNCVAPGWIRTAWGEQASDYWQSRAVQDSLLERWGTPDDVAKLACFLVSPAADFITGQQVAVNGGLRQP